MDPADRQRLRKNWTFLIENVSEIPQLLDFFYEKGVIQLDDRQRVEHEITDSDKVRRLLHIIQTINGSYVLFIQFLSRNSQFIVDQLERTKIDDEEIRNAQLSTKQFITEFLQKHYKEEKGHNVMVTVLEDALKAEYTINGKLYDISDWSEVDKLVKAVFPSSQKKKGGYKRKQFQYRGIKFHSPDADSEKDEIVKSTEEQGCELRQQPGSVGSSRINHLDRFDLCRLLRPEFDRRGLSVEYLKVFEEQNISGEVFTNLELKDMQILFPSSMVFGDQKTIIIIRDELVAAEQNRKSFPPYCLENEAGPTDTKMEIPKGSPEKRFRETFRTFDKLSTSTTVYRKDAILYSNLCIPQNSLDPVHLFISREEYDSLQNDLNQAMIFTAACLNTRTNGTVHIGVQSFHESENDLCGAIEGVTIKKQDFMTRFYGAVRDHFCRDQFEIVCNCIRPPQFIEVSCRANQERMQKKLVIEIDVVPLYEVVREDVFFIYASKEKGSPRETCLLSFSRDKCIPKALSMEAIGPFMTSVNRLSKARAELEKKRQMMPIKKDLKQKFLNLFCSGQEKLTDEVFPILLLSQLESTSNEDDIKENCEFITELEPNVIFDFDASSQEKGIFNYIETTHEKVVKVLTTDDFYRNSSENKENPEKYSKLLDDIRTSAITPWVFCNGYEPLDKEPMNTFNWKKKRREGFQEAIRFFQEEIPENRAVVLFLLFTSNYDVLLEAADEIMSKFPNEWIAFSESEKIISHWKSEMLRRESVDQQQLDRNCIVGIPWKQVNKMIKDVIGSLNTSKCEIPTSFGVPCHLKTKVRNELFDLEVLNMNECLENDVIGDYGKLASLRSEVEEAFFKGRPVVWWNFWFSDQVVKRSQHDDIMHLIKNAAEGVENDDDTKVSIVNLFHQPGAGGTTTAKHILWCLKEKYRCAVVHQIGDETCDQIEKLRNYEDPDSPNPPIILIDNYDEDKIETLYARLEDRARIISKRTLEPAKVFCVLLLCTRRVNLPTKIDPSSIYLKHELSPKELEWFQKTYKRLQSEFDNNNGVDPRLLISFNILKENFDKTYITRAVEEFVGEVTFEQEQKLLQYLSLMNTFDIEFQSLPVSAFDALMDCQQQMKGKTCYSFGSVWRDRNPGLRKDNWETRLSSSMQVILNWSARTGLGSQLKALSIINSLFAKAILDYLLRQNNMTVSGMMKEFLTSRIFKSQNRSLQQLQKIAKDVLIKRDINEQGKKSKFSPLILHILDNEGPDEAAHVLETSFDLWNDAMIAQQVSRLYIHLKNWDNAERYAKIATNSKPENSYLWDTYGQVFKTQLSDKYSGCLKSNEDLSDVEAEHMIDIALKGMSYFQKGQQVSEKEKYRVRSNDAGYYGEIRTMVNLLDLLSFWPTIKGLLHGFLVDPNCIPEVLKEMDQGILTKMKRFHQRSETILRIIEEKLAQLKGNRLNDFIFSRYDHSPRYELILIRENLDGYFGEDNDQVPDDLTGIDAVLFRRRRVKRLGGRSLINILELRRKQDVKNILSTMLSLLIENEKSEFCDSYDMISLINVTLVQGITEDHQRQPFPVLLRWSKKLLDIVIKSKEERPFLEAYLYFVMFHWPTDWRMRYHNDMGNATEVQDAIKKWKVAFGTNHPLQRGDDNPFRKRETTFFFLGKDKSDGDIVYHEKLGMKTKGDIWTQPPIKELLERFSGTLVNDGKDVQVQISTPQGNKISLFVQNSQPIHSRIMYNKRVFFYLGFSWSGPKAFGVSQEEDPTMTQAQKQRQVNCKSKQKPTLTRQIANHGEFRRRLQEIDGKLERIDRLKKFKGHTEKEKQELQSEERLRRERDDLIRKRREYLEH